MSGFSNGMPVYLGCLYSAHFPISHVHPPGTLQRLIRRYPCMFLRIGKYYSLSGKCLPQAHLLKETSGRGAQLEVVSHWMHVFGRQIFPEVPCFDFISCLPLGHLLCSTIHNDVQLHLGPIAMKSVRHRWKPLKLWARMNNSSLKRVCLVLCHSKQRSRQAYVQGHIQGVCK